MKLKKRQLQEAHEELETLRTKSNDMETMMGVVQRAWAQVIYMHLIYVVNIYYRYSIVVN